MAEKLNITIFGAESHFGIKVANELMFGGQQKIENLWCGVHDMNGEASRKLQEMGCKLVSMLEKEKIMKILQKTHTCCVIPNLSAYDKVEDIDQVVKCSQCTIDWCVQSGTKSILLLSQMRFQIPLEPQIPSDLRIVKRLQEIDEYLSHQSSQIQYGSCTLNCGLFQEAFLLFSKQIQQQKSMELPVSSSCKLAPLSVQDCARCTAKILASGDPKDPLGQHRGQRYSLTGPFSHSPKEIVQILCKALGQKPDSIQYAKVSMEQTHKYLGSIMMDFRSTADWPCRLNELSIAWLMDIFELIERNELSKVTDCVSQLIGRPATAIDAFFKENANRFR